MFLDSSSMHSLLAGNIPAYPSVTGWPQPITSHSLGKFFFALGWAWAMLVAFTGWGRFAARLAHIQRLPASVACSLGIAVVIFIGGWLNLIHAIYAGVLFSLVAIGLLFYIGLPRRAPRNIPLEKLLARCLARVADSDNCSAIDSCRAGCWNSSHRKIQRG